MSNPSRAPCLLLPAHHLLLLPACNSLLTTCYLSATACSPFATCLLLPAHHLLLPAPCLLTICSLPATACSSLATACYCLLIACYCLLLPAPCLQAWAVMEAEKGEPAAVRYLFKRALQANPKSRWVPPHLTCLALALPPTIISHHHHYDTTTAASPPLYDTTTAASPPL